MMRACRLSLRRGVWIVALSRWLGPYVFGPLAIYGLVVLAQTMVSMIRKGIMRSVLAMPLLVASHVFYGLGFLRGLTTQLGAHGDKPAAEVILEHLNP